MPSASAHGEKGQPPSPQHLRPGDADWLRHCHGFRVESPRGQRGIVEDVLYGCEHDHPSALAVRGGLFGQRVELIPIETVDSVEPRRKLLTLTIRSEVPESR